VGKKLYHQALFASQQMPSNFQHLGPMEELAWFRVDKNHWERQNDKSMVIAVQRQNEELHFDSNFLFAFRVVITRHEYTHISDNQTFLGGDGSCPNSESPLKRIHKRNRRDVHETMTTESSRAGTNHHQPISIHPP
jgi:hypothetical protein